MVPKDLLQKAISMINTTHHMRFRLLYNTPQCNATCSQKAALGRTARNGIIHGVLFYGVILDRC